jgi:prophage regulatory protein
MEPAAVVTTKPGALELRDAAVYTSLSVSLFQQQVQKDPDFPKPVQLAARRVGWLIGELDAWLASRPRSSCLPPPGSGYGRKGKPQAASS